MAVARLVLPLSDFVTADRGICTQNSLALIRVK
jgi:hypothetical protein